MEVRIHTQLREQLEREKATRISLQRQLSAAADKQEACGLAVQAL